MYQTVVIAIHLLAATSVVLLVLLQQGKGAESGASFGSGASATVFGSQGSSTFLSRLTAIFTAVFFVTSLGLAYFAKQQSKQLSEVGLPDAAVIESSSVPVKAPVATDVPVLDAKSKAADKASELDVPVVPTPPASSAQ